MKVTKEQIDKFVCKYPKLSFALIVLIGVGLFVIFSLLNQLGNPNGILNP